MYEAADGSERGARYREVGSTAAYEWGVAIDE
jgi:hypothetical protein